MKKAMIQCAVLGVFCLGMASVYGEGKKEWDFNRYGFSLPSMPAGGPDYGYQVYESGCFEMVDANVPPSPENRRGAWATFACPSQYQPLCLVVYAVRDLQNLRVVVTDLSGKEGVIPSDQIQVNYVKRYLERNKYTSPPEDSSVVERFLERKTGIDLPANHFKSIWVMVKTPAEAKAGTYTGTIRIQADNAPEQKLPLSLEVLPFKLQNVPGRRYGVYYTIPRNEQRIRAELKDMMDHGANVVEGALGGGRRKCEIWYAMDEDGRIQISYSNIEKWLKLLRSVNFPSGPVMIYMGFERLALMLGHTDAIPYSDNRCMKSGKGETLSQDKAFMAYAKQAIEGLNSLKKEYPEYELVLTDLDEIYWGLDPLYIEFVKAARQVPGYRFYITLDMDDKYKHDIQKLQQVDPYVDIRCFGGGSVEYWMKNGRSLKDLEDNLKQTGDETWIYYNIHSTDVTPKLYRFVNGLYMWALPISGNCPYIYQATQGNPFDESDGHDYGFSFPSNEDGQPVATKIWEAYRQGIYDLQYIYLLESQVQQHKDKGGKDVQDAETFLKNLKEVLLLYPSEKNGLTTTWTELFKDTDMKALRYKIARQIIKLQND